MHDRGDVRPDPADHEGGDAEQALELANDSPYGLQASVWTKDTARGESIASRIDAGVANVNEHQVSYLALEMPMGGWKTSGLGSRHGKDGIRKYARKQSSVVTRFGPKKELFMFPYSKRNSKIIGALVRRGGPGTGRGRRPVCLRRAEARAAHAPPCRRSPCRLSRPAGVRTATTRRASRVKRPANGAALGVVCERSPATSGGMRCGLSGTNFSLTPRAAPRLAPAAGSR